MHAWIAPRQALQLDESLLQRGNSQEGKQDKASPLFGIHLLCVVHERSQMPALALADDLRISICPCLRVESECCARRVCGVPIHARACKGATDSD